MSRACFAAIPEVASEKSKGARSLGMRLLKIVADGHTKIFGAVCDLKALTMEEIGSLSMVLLTFRDSQKSALLWVDSKSSRAVRSLCGLMESPSFLM